MNSKKLSPVENVASNVIITGASKGIGKAIADKFAAHGYNLVLCSKNEDRLLQAVEDIRQKSKDCKILSYPADLRNKNQAQAFGKWILKKGVTIDILVNNAGD